MNDLEGEIMFSVLTDFEGTLITDNGTINEDDLKTLKKLLNNNVHICIVSSASFDKLKEFKNLLNNIRSCRN